MKSDNVPEVPENAMHSTLEKYQGWTILVLNSESNFYYRIEDARAVDESLIEGAANAYKSQAEALTAAKKHIDRLLTRDRLIQILDTLIGSNGSNPATGALYAEFLKKIDSLTETDC